MVLVLSEVNCSLPKERLKSGENYAKIGLLRPLRADIQSSTEKGLLKLKLWHITQVHIRKLCTNFNQNRPTFISKSAPVSQAKPVTVNSWIAK